MSENEPGLKARPKVIALVDYENIVREAAVRGELIDFEKLVKLCREFGDLVAGYLFVPKHNSYDPWLNTAHEHGFFTVAVPPPSNPERPKQHENADTIMIDLGCRFLALNVDIIVVVAYDGDFLTLANQVRDRGRQVILVTGEKVARALTHAVDLVYPLPAKTTL